MSKVTEFYAKAMENEEIKNELIKILGDKKFEEADDTQLAKIGEVAKKMGYEISMDEAKAYFSKEDAELDVDDLDAVAGGKYDNSSVVCTNGVGSVEINV